MIKALFRVLGLPLTLLALAAILATPSALAGGDPTGPSPVDLTLDGFALTKDGAVVFNGTVVCRQAADVAIQMVVQQGPVSRFVDVRHVTELGCDAGTAAPIEVVFAPEHPGRFHPGAITVGIELDACTVPDANGDGVCINQFGIVDREVRHSQGG